MGKSPLQAKLTLETEGYLWMFPCTIRVIVLGIFDGDVFLQNYFLMNSELDLHRPPHFGAI